jgi:hypothetical protein
LLPQRGIDDREHTVKVTINFVIPKPQDSKTAAFKTLIAHPVALRMIVEIVLTLIDLNNEPMAHAYEIDDRAPAR